VSQRSEILAIVKAEPGAIMHRINALMPHYKNPSAEVSQMLRTGELRAEKRGKVFHYFLGDGKAIIPKKLQLSEETKLKKQIEALESRNGELFEKNMEMAEWIKKAIERYPDLAISDEVKKAREYALAYYTKLGDKQKMADIRAGRCDNTPIIQIALMAIES
jgi:hypothetical protein